MSVISILSFMICFFILSSSVKKGADIFSPGRVFAFVWSLVVGLTDLKLSWLQHEWSAEIWLQVLMGPVSFLIGTLSVYIINIGNKIEPLYRIRNFRDSLKLDNSRLFTVVMILFFLFILGYIIIYLKTNEIPIFSRRPGKARLNFTMFGLGLFLHNVVLIVYLSSVYFVFQSQKKINKTVLISVSFISFILYAMTLQRYQIFLTILLIFILMYYTTNKIKLKVTFIIALLIIIFFYLISSLRAGEVVIYLLYNISKMKYSVDYAIFTEPYMYVVMNIENLARSIEKNEFYTYGFYTFDFLSAIAGLKHWVEEYFYLNETPFLISSYNTYSAFWTYFRDFGIIGISFIPFIGGALISTLYYSLRKNPTLLKISIYGLLLFAIIFSFFNSAFGFLWFVYNTIVLIIIFKFISNRNSINRINHS